MKPSSLFLSAVAFASLAVANNPDDDPKIFWSLQGSNCDPAKFGPDVTDQKIQFLGRADGPKQQYMDPRDNPKYFCETRWNANHLPVTTIEAWPSTDGLRVGALRFGYTGDNGIDYGPMYGDASIDASKKQTITLAPGETITEVSMKDDQWVWWVGALSITTSNNQHINLGDFNTRTSTVTLAQEQLGSGVLLGAYGISATFDWQHPADQTDNIRALGFIFLQPKIKGVTVQNIRYDDADVRSPSNIRNEGFQMGSYYNSLDHNVTATQESWLAVEKSHTFTSSSTVEGKFGAKISTEFEASIPLLGKASTTGEASFEVGGSQQKSEESSETERVTLRCSLQAVVPSKSGVKAVATITRGSALIHYTSDVVLQLDNGKSITYPEPGVLNVTDYSGCTVNAQPDSNASPANSLPADQPGPPTPLNSQPMVPPDNLATRGPTAPMPDASADMASGEGSIPMLRSRHYARRDWDFQANLLKW